MKLIMITETRAHFTWIRLEHDNVIYTGTYFGVLYDFKHQCISETTIDNDQKVTSNTDAIVVEYNSYQKIIDNLTLYKTIDTENIEYLAFKKILNEIAENVFIELHEIFK